jgi:hypothetical protein
MASTRERRNDDDERVAYQRVPNQMLGTRKR